MDFAVYDAFQMGENRYAGFVLHARHEALAAARHDHIEIAREAFQHFAHRRAVSHRHKRDCRSWQARRTQAFHQTGVNGGRGMKRIRAAAQDRRIAGFQAQRARIRRHIGAAFVNYPDDAERRRNTLDSQSIGAVEGCQQATDRIRQGRNILKALRDGFDARLIQHQAIQIGLAHASSLARRHVFGVGGDDFGNPPAHRGGGPDQGAVFLLGRRKAKRVGGGAGFAAKRQHDIVNGAGVVETVNVFHPTRLAEMASGVIG